jgi:hypothetical protein
LSWDLTNFLPELASNHDPPFSALDTTNCEGVFAVGINMMTTILSYGQVQTFT